MERRFLNRYHTKYQTEVKERTATTKKTFGLFGEERKTCICYIKFHVQKLYFLFDAYKICRYWSGFMSILEICTDMA